MTCVQRHLQVVVITGRPTVGARSSIVHSGRADHLKTHLRVSPVEYLQLWGRFFNGITLPEARPMDVETDWLGAIKQSLEGSSDHSP